MKKVKKYYFNKKIFRIYFLIVVMFGVFAMLLANNHYKISCPENAISNCKNNLKSHALCSEPNNLFEKIRFWYLDKLMFPHLKEFLYNNGLCQTDYLFRGVSFEYGKPNPFWIQNFVLFIIVSLGGLLVFNHYKYNKDFDFEREE